MRILLVGEGPNELEGALETLVRRLGLAEAEIATDVVKNPNVHAHHGKKGQGYSKRAIRWVLEAAKRGYDALVLVIDRDKFPERVRQIADAQQSPLSPLPRALGVAIRTFDAWMLADEHALTQVLGYEVSRQREPEGMADPKGVARGLIENSDPLMSPSTAYAAIANVIDLSSLESRCRKGFRPFAERVRQI